MEIADTKGPWQLELELEDRRIEHLLRGLKLANDGQLQVQLPWRPNQIALTRYPERSVQKRSN